MTGAHRHRQRGVSLVEAIVALGVMAFGMLGMVGLQSTLRSNGDLSRQRTEAVRIAQESLEDWRRFVALETVAGQVDYAEIVSSGPTASAGINATYQVTRTVTPSDSPRMKTLQVRVGWTDRGGQNQVVELDTLLAGVAPDLAGSLPLPAHGVPTRQPGGRNRSIPVQASDLGDGTSAFVPPQSSAGTTVTAWVFNNVSGLVTGVCTLPSSETTESISAGDVAACSNNTLGQLLRGYVRFANTTVAPGAAEAENPTGVPRDLNLTLTLTSSLTHPAPPVCFDNAESVAPAATPGAAVSYYCVVFSTSSGRWSGRSRIAPIGGWVVGSASGHFKICRYTPLSDDTGLRNVDHPLDYTEAGSPPYASLSDQNFLVISALHTCPTETPTAGDLVNSNTRLHQDGSATYNN